MMVHVFWYLFLPSIFYLRTHPSSAVFAEFLYLDLGCDEDYRLPKRLNDSRSSSSQVIFLLRKHCSTVVVTLELCSFDAYEWTFLYHIEKEDRPLVGYCLNCRVVLTLN
jgi:hypothetical protein